MEYVVDTGLGSIYHMQYRCCLSFCKNRRQNFFIVCGAFTGAPDSDPLCTRLDEPKELCTGQYRTESPAKVVKIGKIDSRMTGTVLKVKGIVEKISFKWLNRPHFHLKDEGAGIRAVMFTAPSQNIQVGDRVEVLGIVVKHLLTKHRLIISAVSITKIENS